MSTCRWLTYDFTIYGMEETNWNEIGGIYIFAGSTTANQWKGYYIGKAESFKSRLSSNHEQWRPAQRLGASHVHAMVVTQEASRVAIEKELIQQVQPRLNTQHK